MKGKLIALAALLVLSATDASAQVGDITGRYICVRGCRGDKPAFIAQAENYFDYNLVNEAGQTARAWVDFPGHLWIQRWNEGAIFALDAVTILFDNGTVWKRSTQWDRALDAMPPPLLSRPR
jgi:hypothetical protein